MMSEFIQGEAGHATFWRGNGYESSYSDGQPLPCEPPERRPCIGCQQPPTVDGHDPCIANLPGVQYACCGHGYLPGYVSFVDGRVFRFDGKTGTEIRTIVDQHQHGLEPLPEGYVWDP